MKSGPLLKTLLFALAALFAVSLVSIAFSIVSGVGLEPLVEVGLARYFPSEHLEVGKIEGDPRQGYVIHGLLARNLDTFPEDSQLRIKKMTFKPSFPLGLGKLEFHLLDGQLRWPGSDPILIGGGQGADGLRLSLYSKGASVQGLMEVLPVHPGWQDLRGMVNDVDFLLTGDLKRPVLQGSLRVGRLSRKNLELVDVPGDVSLQLSELWGGAPQVEGDLRLSGGEVHVEHLRVQVLESHVRFSGDPLKPYLDLRGHTRIRATPIDIKIQGGIEDLKLKVSSDSGLPQHRLLLLLATGKDWQGVETVAEGQPVSANLAADFIDFFLFGGKAQQLLESLGIVDFNVRYDEKGKGAGVKTEFGERANMGYQYQEEGTGVDRTTKHTVEAGVNVTETISVNVEKDVKGQSALTDELQTESTGGIPVDRVNVEYKKKF
ncbi:MAG: translocation/assembly module TamB domain-containing protein [Candidatus Omnitrophica bacterium]|nr:translocation/assembly module TamB domain-containing protein [Candidatus Omnitrophota bacterium]